MLLDAVASDYVYLGGDERSRKWFSDDLIYASGFHDNVSNIQLLRFGCSKKQLKQKEKIWGKNRGSESILSLNMLRLWHYSIYQPVPAKISITAGQVQHLIQLRLQFLSLSPALELVFFFLT